MESELSQATFESRLHYVASKYLAYVDLKNSPFVLIALHQHLGLANYFRIMIQALSGNRLSLLIPNLFGQVRENSYRQEEDEAFLQQLNQARIAQTIAEIVQETTNRGKKLILVGMSLGASIGLKMLEFFPNIEFGMFFYGVPPFLSLQPERIKTRTIIYIGGNDKVKHISDRETISKIKQICQNNKMIQIKQLPGLEHGFMNPACEYYNQQAFKKCSKHFEELLKDAEESLKSNIKNIQKDINHSEQKGSNSNKQQNERDKNQGKQNQGGGCHLI